MSYAALAIARRLQNAGRRRDCLASRTVSRMIVDILHWYHDWYDIITISTRSKRSQSGIGLDATRLYAFLT